MSFLLLSYILSSHCRREKVIVLTHDLPTQSNCLFMTSFFMPKTVFLTCWCYKLNFIKRFKMFQHQVKTQRGILVTHLRWDYFGGVSWTNKRREVFCSLHIWKIALPAMLFSQLELRDRHKWIWNYGSANIELYPYSNWLRQFVFRITLYA